MRQPYQLLRDWHSAQLEIQFDGYSPRLDAKLCKIEAEMREQEEIRRQRLRLEVPGLSDVKRAQLAAELRRIAKESPTEQNPCEASE